MMRQPTGGRLDGWTAAITYSKQAGHLTENFRKYPDIYCGECAPAASAKGEQTQTEVEDPGATKRVIQGGQERGGLDLAKPSQEEALVTPRAANAFSLLEVPSEKGSTRSLKRGARFWSGEPGVEQRL